MQCMKIVLKANNKNAQINGKYNIKTYLKSFMIQCVIHI